MSDTTTSTGNDHGTLFGFERYTQIEFGDVNILISVPHDGYLRPVIIQLLNYSHKTCTSLKPEGTNKAFPHFLYYPI